MNILEHAHKSRRSCLLCGVVGHKSRAEKPGRRELYPRELFVTNGPKKSANGERPAAVLCGRELPSSPSLVRSMESPAQRFLAQVVASRFRHKNECCTHGDPMLA
jgi:hypothetical protein